MKILIVSGSNATGMVVYWATQKLRLNRAVWECMRTSRPLLLIVVFVAPARPAMVCCSLFKCAVLHATCVGMQQIEPERNYAKSLPLARWAKRASLPINHICDWKSFDYKEKLSLNSTRTASNEKNKQTELACQTELQLTDTNSTDRNRTSYLFAHTLRTGYQLVNRRDSARV